MGNDVRMKEKKMISLETANPEFSATQQEILSCIQNRPDISPSTLRKYEQFLSDDGIQTRYFGLTCLEEIFQETPDESIDRFQRIATEIGSRALEKALESAKLETHELDGLIVTTCTGYLCPGLTSYISEKAGLPNNIYALDLSGLGCGAAIPGLRAADAFLNSKPNLHVALVCVEVCSAAMYWGQEIDLILSNSIFSDGAACAILTNREEKSGLKIEGFNSLLWPEHREELRFKHKNARLCNVISPKVPSLVVSAMNQLMDLCHDANDSGEIPHVAFHPGGRKILDQLEHQIPELQGQLTASRKVLRHYGNMSSPSVLFVLKEILANGQLAEADSIFLFAFGAGFSAFGMKLRYQENLKRLATFKKIPHDCRVR